MPEDSNPDTAREHWLVCYRATETGDSWLVGDDLRDVGAALALRTTYLTLVVGVEERGRVVIIGPQARWPSCVACLRPLNLIAGIARCVYDTCPHGTDTQTRQLIRQLVQALRGRSAS